MSHPYTYDFPWPGANEVGLCIDTTRGIVSNQGMRIGKNLVKENGETFVVYCMANYRFQMYGFDGGLGLADV